jgi:hypothetical protein
MEFPKMIKNKRATAGVIFAFIVIGILIGGGGYIISDKLDLKIPNLLNKQEVFSSSYCTAIPNPSDPTASYTERTSSTTFTCTNADECIVWGSMNVQKSPTTDTVVLRTGSNNHLDIGASDGWIALDDDRNGVLDGYFRSGSSYGKENLFVSGGAILLDIKAPGGFNVYKCPKSFCRSSIFSQNNIGIYVGNFMVAYESDSGLFSTVELTSPYPVPGYEDKETSSLGNTPYKAKFNFCPTSNFESCEGGTKNKVNSLGWHTTSEWRIAKGQSFTFTPKYADNEVVNEQFIYSRNGNCICANENNRCELNQFNCKRCPNGYSYSENSVFCKNKGNRYVAGQCYSGTGRYDGNNQCTDPYTSYTQCDSTHTVTIGSNQGQCNWWGDSHSCDIGQKCYLGSSGNDLGEGLGSCRCINNPCGINDVQVNPDDSQQFRKCELKTSGCYDWETSWSLCAPGLIYDISAGHCVCSNENSCDPVGDGESECTSSNAFRECNEIPITDNLFNNEVRNCNRWSNTFSCDSSSSCNLNTGSCDCENLECEIGSVVCNGRDDYYGCSIKNGKLCPSRDDTTTSVSNNKECVNNQIQSKPGCQYNQGICSQDEECVSNTCVCKETGDYCKSSDTDTCIGSSTTKNCKLIQGSGCYKWEESPCTGDTKCFAGKCENFGCGTTNSEGYECSTQKDTNDILIESCEGNECKSVQDDFKATKEEYIAYQLSQTAGSKCIGSSIYKVVKYETRDNEVYRWELELTCGGDTPVCVEIE